MRSSKRLWFLPLSIAIFFFFFLTSISSVKAFNYSQNNTFLLSFGDNQATFLSMLSQNDIKTNWFQDNMNDFTCLSGCNLQPGTPYQMTLYGLIDGVYGINDPTGYYENWGDMSGLYYNTNIVPHISEYTLSGTFYYILGSNSYFAMVSPDLQSPYLPKNFTLEFCLDDACEPVFYLTDYYVSGSEVDYEYSILKSNQGTKGIYFNKVRMTMYARAFEGGTYDNKAGMIEFMFINKTILKVENNKYPVVKLTNYLPYYCVNRTNPDYKFYLNITDEDEDDISYFAYWDNSNFNRFYVDRFDDDEYKLIDNGWYKSDSGCLDFVRDGVLRLNQSCDDVTISKVISNAPIEEDVNFLFYTYLNYNSSVDYCLTNEFNENIGCIRLNKVWDNEYNFNVMNLSYWNGTDYVWFDNTWYGSLETVEFQKNSTHIQFCINGIDENSLTGCNQVFSEELHGTTNDNVFKFTVTPSYDFTWANDNEIYLDDISYMITDVGDWLTYELGDYVERYIFGQEEHELTVLATDSAHDDYSKYVFTIKTYGYCEFTVDLSQDDYVQDTNWNTLQAGSRNFILGVTNGKAIFNKVFYIALLILALWLVISIHSLELALALTGFCGLLTSWVITGDLTQMISSSVLIGLGIAILIAKST